MFGIGMPEMLLILAVALIVIGPKKLPDLAKSLGKALGEFKKATSELKDSLQVDDELKEVKTTFDELNRDFKDSRPAAARRAQQNAANEATTETIAGNDPVDGVGPDAEPADDKADSDTAVSDENDRPTGDATHPKAEPRKAEPT